MPTFMFTYFRKRLIPNFCHCVVVGTKLMSVLAGWFGKYVTDILFLLLLQIEDSPRQGAEFMSKVARLMVKLQM